MAVLNKEHPKLTNKKKEEYKKGRIGLIGYEFVHHAHVHYQGSALRCFKLVKITPINTS